MATLGSGTVDLRSGTWEWQLLGGERIRLLHLVQRGGTDNQMWRPLVSRARVDETTIRTFAAHPGTRVWVAPDHQRWMVHDLASLARIPAAGPRELLLVSREGERFNASVTDSLELGSLTDAELLELRERASSPPRP